MWLTLILPCIFISRSGSLLGRVFYYYSYVDLNFMTNTSPPEAPIRKFELLPDEVLIDDVFVIRETRYGLFTSTTKDGRAMLTGADRDNVEIMTRWHLKCEQEGWPEGSVSKARSATVSGKL